jgi:hypothetical protein
MDEQNQNGAGGLDQFIDELIGDKANDLSQDALLELKKGIAVELDDALNRAVLNKLSDKALEEIEGHIDDDPAVLSQFILTKATEENLDLNAITLDTMLQFRALYTGEVLADDLDSDDEDDEEEDDEQVDSAEEDE